MVCVPAATTKVEIENRLLERLRRRDPGKSDRELLEAVARIVLGREAIRRAQEDFALDEAEAVAVGARLAREARRELAAERRASG
jgi:hypothetical protein